MTTETKTKPTKSYAIIQGINFPTKVSLEKHIQTLVANAPKTELKLVVYCKDNNVKIPLDQIAALPKDTENFIRELFETKYARYDEKIGDRGIAHIFMSRNLDYQNTFCFYVVRDDGSFTDISWRECLDAKNEKALCQHLVRKALRSAVVYQILDFKSYIFSSGLEIRCPYTNEVLTRENCHIDHVAPRTFEAIVQEFLNVNQITNEDIKLSKAKDLCSVRDILDTELVAKWQQFHRANCHLRALSQNGNTSGAKKDRAGSLNF